MSGPAGITVLCVNTGSSSVKVSLYAVAGAAARRLASGLADRVGAAGGGALTVSTAASVGGAGDAGEPVVTRSALPLPGHATALRALIDALAAAGAPQAQAVGHRVVHGGDRYTAPVLIDAAVVATVLDLARLAPLHNPPAAAGMGVCADLLPGRPQVACFDTAFHATMPPEAAHLPLDRQAWADGVRRYGFHGLSYEFVVTHLGAAAGRRLVIAHLGNGASMVAVLDGRSVDTTMGLTPTGGLVMGTRPGDLDPGAVVHLARTRGLDADGLDTLLNRRSGLLGLSGRTSDMRALLAARQAGDSDADLAVGVFCRTVRKTVGAYAATLGGLDTLVFTGGIGQYAPAVRAQVCTGLEFLGVRLDPARNAVDAEVISADGAPVTVRVVHTDEDLVVARHTAALVGATR